MEKLIAIQQNTNKHETIPTMSSIEIAELCGKRHGHVMQDIRKLFSELKIDLSNFAGLYKDSTGRTLPCYHLPKRESLIVILGYNTVLRAKIIDYWKKLEEQAANPQIDFSRPEIRAAIMMHLKNKIKQTA
ncbi:MULTISPECIES: Rha family transcriptional regulator [Bartonella]|uniref:Rha family phage regulatory protein n=2 Tax=Bartonella TaxID=773 RepID=A0A840E028_9HYPH|nr:Rha family transcriptional regulator [Bartonella fuyuanensis]MBB4077102.1 Rha family phage regulatory protein [Bartonella fuyuanensis]